MNLEIALNIFLCVTALALHFMTKWNEHRNDVAKIGLKQFFNERPAMNAVAVLSTVIAFVGTYALEWMNPGMAIASGYMGNSVAVKMIKGFMK